MHRHPTQGIVGSKPRIPKSDATDDSKAKKARISKLSEEYLRTPDGTPARQVVDRPNGIGCKTWRVDIEKTCPNPAGLSARLHAQATPQLAGGARRATSQPASAAAQSAKNVFAALASASLPTSPIGTIVRSPFRTPVTENGTIHFTGTIVEERPVPTLRSPEERGPRSLLPEFLAKRG